MKAYRKGRDFELFIAKMLRHAGFDAQRMPRSGAIDGLDSDLLVKDLPCVFELKKQETWSIPQYMKQAEGNAQSTNKMPVVIVSKNNLPDPYVVMKLSDFIVLLQRAFVENKLPIAVGMNAFTKHKQINGR
jgi:hypothetical protein